MSDTDDPDRSGKAAEPEAPAAPDGAHGAPTSEDHEATRAAVIAAGGSLTASHDEHEASAPLGPLDAQAWGAGILGVATGGLVAVLLYLASYH